MPIKEPGALSRRHVLAALSAGALSPLTLSLLPQSALAAVDAPSPGTLFTSAAALADDQARRAFDFFWQQAHPVTGLVPDRLSDPSVCNIGGMGFCLSALIIGVQRGWITRAQGRDRVWTTLRGLLQAPQGEQASGTAGHRGFFYRFLSRDNFQRAWGCELSTVDTSLLLGGVLHCQSFFTGSDAVEAEIRSKADELYRRVDWVWAQNGQGSISHGWKPEGGFLPYAWRGYNEAMLVYLLALGSPTHAVDASAWNEWTQDYQWAWGTRWGQTCLHFGSIFGHFFTHGWVDLRGIRDAYMRDKDLDYVENSRRAIKAARQYAIENPRRLAGYDAQTWSLTASDGPGFATMTDALGIRRRFGGYSAHYMNGDDDDGTIAPYGAVCAMAFEPVLASESILSMYRRYGGSIYGRYGFMAFNRTLPYPFRSMKGRFVNRLGWVDSEDYLAIEVGPALLMLENHRNGSLWASLRGNPYLRTGLQRAGFTGGWLG